MAPFGVTRRRFVAWVSALVAAQGWRPVRAAPVDNQPAGDLPQELLVALGEAVLPGELGADGAVNAVRAFTTWIQGYRAGAERVHPYGSDEISTTGPSPVASWRQQLVALDGAARATHRQAFPSLGVRDRQAVVRSALSGLRLGNMPDPLAAPHVAVALLAHFYGSPDAVDLCYRARIRVHECRPLATSGRQPLPLAGRRA